MTTAVIRRLPELAAEITKEHRLCEGSYRTALGHAVKVGELLIEAKAQLSHGEWMTWLSRHVEFGDRRARGYMQLASSPEIANRQPNADLGIEEALRSIAQPVAKPPTGDLRAALRGVDPADAKAALAELGPMRSEADPFPSSMAEREAWRLAHEGLGRIKRAMDEASATGLSKWSRREALHEASRHARRTAAQLSELADAMAT